MSNDESKTDTRENLLKIEKLKAEHAAIELTIENLRKEQRKVMSSIYDEERIIDEKISADWLQKYLGTPLETWGYVDNGNETVTHIKNGLMWKKYREPDEYTWKKAMKLFNKKPGKIKFAGFSDWRLPTIDELKTLILKDQHPPICQRAFPADSEAPLWSSSPFVPSPDYAWVVNFHDGGGPGLCESDASVDVRLVRVASAP